MKLGLYQTMSGQGFNGPNFTPDQTLKAAANYSMKALRDSMVKITAIHTGRTLEAQLDELPTRYVDDLNDTYFDIVDSSRRNIQLEKAVDVKGNPITKDMLGVGKNGELMYLFFPEDYFFEGEVIVGEKNEKYPIRVLKREAAGTNVKYTCQMFGRPNGIPGEELQLGKKFSKEYAPVERGLSREVGGINRPSTARVKQFMSTIRIDHKVSGDINDYGMIFGLPAINKKGETVVFNAVSSQEDWLVEQEFQMYKANALYFGTTNIDANGETYDKGQSGRNIIMGSGLRELQEQSNKMYFNYFSLDLLENATNALAAGTSKLTDLNFTIKTGIGGSELFSKAVADKASGWQTLSDNNPAVITKVASQLHTNALSFGALFTQYKAPNGAVFTVEVDASYDDTVRNKIMMPGRNMPAESFRMDIFYKGSAENPNIQKLALKKMQSIGGEYRGYSAGFRNPLTGEVNNNHMSYTEDAATITKFTHLGIAMYNVDKSISLIPMILA